jgi:DNA-binding transcriptional LysR family regulator
MFVTPTIKEIDMARNLDLNALRSFVTVAEAGGVTVAASRLHLTQSAVSMQLKRLEESMGLPLMDRSARTIGLTPHGEQLLSYGRRLLALNDEVWSRLTDQAYEGEIALGVPGDIVYPHIPQVLKQFAADYPRVKVQLVSSYTTRLKEMYQDGKLDLILTTEITGDPRAELLANLPMVWCGGVAGQAARARPLRLAYETGCLFRTSAQEALDRAGIAWETSVETRSSRTVEATVSADLAVTPCLKGTEPPQWEEVPKSFGLPELPVFEICMYSGNSSNLPLADKLAGAVRRAYGKVEETGRRGDAAAE